MMWIVVTFSEGPLARVVPEQVDMLPGGVTIPSDT